MNATAMIWSVTQGREIFVVQLPTYKTKERVKGEPPASVDIAIVGAGLGSLTAGAFLAQNGWRVALFDTHYVAGGCGTQFARGSGDHRFLFDVGLHYIGDCQPQGKIPTILRGLDVDVDFVQMDPEGFDVFRFPDFTFRMPSDYDLFRQRLLELFPEERRGIDKYIKFLRQVNEVTLLSERVEGKITPGIALHVLLKGWHVLRFQNSTFKNVLDAFTKNPKLQAVLSAQHGDHALAPSKVSAMLHGGLVNHYIRGAYYPKGGGQIISDKIAESIEASGGSIHLRREVTEIIMEGNRAVGLRTRSHRGEEHEVRAKVVLSGADVIQTFKRLVGPEHLPNRWQKKLNTWKMAHALFIMFLGVKTDLRKHGMEGVNYWNYEDYDIEAFYKRMEQKTLAMPTCSYTTSASLKDPESTAHAPAGHQTLEIMTMVPGEPHHWNVSPEEIANWSYRHKESYLALKEQVEEKLLSHLEDQFPGVRENIVMKESATPVSHIRYTQATGGTSYGLACTPDQFLDKRPGYSTPIQGLYVCGANSRSGHGIVGAMSSGHESASDIARALKRPLAPIYS